MRDKKHIDDLITRRETHEADLNQIGEEIRKSARKAAVAFIDLSDSTALKESSQPEVWLGYVYKFIRTIERLVRQFGGTVVKRIGDEVPEISSGG
ncbi:MAG: adenylate/guanylate cyclase domain-containing protein [bacterium]